MLRQSITRLLTGIALLCASVAWSGWIFLHTVGDPHRAERIAHAILDSPDARAEIAAPLTDQIAANLQLPEAQKAQIATAVADVLGDPDIIGNFVAAFGSAQANALGVVDDRPTTLDAGRLINAVRARLAEDFPEVAAQIPVSTATVDLPKVQSPVISRLRSLADTWTMYLGLTAAALLVGLMIFGDRRRVLHSYGFWAILTGAFWAIGPRLAPWIARRSAPQADAVVGATIDAVAGTITLVATIMVVSGVIALVVRYTVLAGNPDLDRYAPHADAGQYGALQPVLAQQGQPTYGYTVSRTDQVPAQPQYQQSPYQQTPYQQAPYQQAPYQQAPFQQGQYAPGQYAPTGQQQYATAQQAQDAATTAQPTVGGGPDELWSTGFAPAQPSHSTPIPDTQDLLQRHDTVPLVIRPLDLPTSSDVLSPLHHRDDDNA